MTTRFQLGHTAYNHLGALPGDCIPGQRQHRGSSPYYLFGAQRRYPYAWAGGAGGVPWSRVAPESRGLGIFDLRESGLSPSPEAFRTYSALDQTIRHRGMPTQYYVPAGDWPLTRPSGREPDDPRGDGRGGLGLSDNEKKLGMLLAVAGLGYLAWKKFGAKKNPVRKRFEVKATASRRARQLEYAGSFVSKSAAEDYADYLRKGGHKARVTKKRTKKRTQKR